MMDAALTKITNARASLILKAPFYASLALRMPPKVAPPGKLLPGSPAGVDGKNIYYNPALIEELTHGETVGLIAHEASHPALKHHLRRDGRDPLLWNLACDFAINPILLDAGFELPGGGAVRDDFKGMATESIYKILAEEQSEGWEPESEESIKQTGEVLDWPGNDPGDDSSGDPGPDMPGGPADPGNDPGGPPTPAEKRAEESRWDTATAAAMLQAAGTGTMPGGTLAMVQESISPRVPWRDILAPFLQRTNDDYSWSPPDRRFVHRGLLMPSLNSEGLARVVLAVDTSGSMPQALVNEILGETAEILEQWPGVELTIIYHHTAVWKTETYTVGNPPTLAEYESGGTDFRPVFDHAETLDTPPDCMVLLTDLQGPAPNDPPEYPVLWVSYGRDDAPWGEIVKVN